MSRKLLALGMPLLTLSAVVAAAPVQAGGPAGDGSRFSPAPGHARPHPGHGYRPHARMLPPETPYRDPRMGPRRQARPDFLIHAYLPRPTEQPMYNEPPKRWR